MPLYGSTYVLLFYLSTMHSVYLFCVFVYFPFYFYVYFLYVDIVK